MFYQLLANLMLFLHLAFVIFAVFGGFLILRRRWFWKLHLPALVWGFLVQFFIWTCPLTVWENYFRRLAGQSGYAAGGFIEYYLTVMLYPPITPQLHLVLALALVFFNLFVYSYVFFSLRRYP